MLSRKVAKIKKRKNRQKIKHFRFFYWSCIVLMLVWDVPDQILGSDKFLITKTVSPILKICSKK